MFSTWMLQLTVRLAVVVGVVHGLRGIGKACGPQWGGLVAGLPCSTAIVLGLHAMEHDLVSTAQMAQSSLLGLISAVALSLTYSILVHWGVRPGRALGTAVAAYLLLAGGFSQLLSDDAWSSIFFVTLSLLAMGVVAGRLRVPRHAASIAAIPPWAGLALRSIVPVVAILMIVALGNVVGETWAGLLSTFPCTLVSLLLLTQWESGPVAAGDMARTFPRGSLCMIPFIAVIHFWLPWLGLCGGLLCGYAASLLTLLAIEGFRCLWVASPAGIPNCEGRRGDLGIA